MNPISLVSSLRTTGAIVASTLFLIYGFTAAAEITLPRGADFSILPAPPADGSPAGLADLSVLLYVQTNRTADQVKFAKAMESPSVFAMGREVFGEWFTRDNLPKTSEILGQTSKAANPVLNNAKKNWKRPRPYMRSTEISPVVGKPGDAGSYPSGHTYGMAVPMFLLAAAFPSHASEFDEKTHRVMWGRIVGGVHFPSDTEAGRLLAQDVVNKMVKTKEMKDALETIRAEVAPFIAKAAAETKGPKPQ